MTLTDYLRTPDDRFVGLPDFPFEPHYFDTLPGYEGARARYLDLGPPDADHTFLTGAKDPDADAMHTLHAAIRDCPDSDALFGHVCPPMFARRMLGRWWAFSGHAGGADGRPVRTCGSA